MASRAGLPIFDRLRIKYGLTDNPSTQLVEQWRQSTNTYSARGFGKEEAGRLAATVTFPGFGTRVYASEADTVDTLLTEALKK